MIFPWKNIRVKDHLWPDGLNYVWRHQRKGCSPGDRLFNGCSTINLLLYNVYGHLKYNLFWCSATGDYIYDWRWYTSCSMCVTFLRSSDHQLIYGMYAESFSQQTWALPDCKRFYVRLFIFNLYNTLWRIQTLQDAAFGVDLRDHLMLRRCSVFMSLSMHARSYQQMPVC